MKRRIDLEKASAAETFGALAVSANRKHRLGGGAEGTFTSAQSRAMIELVRSLFQVARRAGAQRRRVDVAGVSFELREDGTEEILSIRTASGS